MGSLDHSDNAGDKPPKHPVIFVRGVQQPDGFLRYSTRLGDTVRMRNMPQASTDYFARLGCNNPPPPTVA